MEKKKGNKCNTIKKNRVEKRIEKNKKRMLDELEKNMGIVRHACNKVGIAAKTFYVWTQEDEEFAKQVEIVDWGQKYYVESKLITKITQDDTACIIFYLKCRHPKYKIKAEVDVNDSRALEQMRKDFEDLISKVKSDHDVKPRTAKHTG